MSAGMSRWQSLQRKPIEWIVRYGPGEVAGTLFAWAGSWLIFRLSQNEIAAAYGAAMGENVGFYGVMILSETLRATRSEKPIGRSIAKLLVEFGPAELLDSFIIRPAAMGIATHLLGGATGVIVGKIVADITFYVPVILIYELRKARSID